MKKRTSFVAVILGSILLPTMTIAQVATFGDMANTVGRQAGDVADLIGVAVFILGVLLAAMGLMKFRQNSQNPQDPQAKISTAFVLVFVGAAMVAMPTLLGVGVTSFFGQGAQTTAANPGENSNMRNIRTGN